MPLPEPADRSPNHRRTVVYDSFRRADGRWDIDARVVDAKASRYYDLERGWLDAGEPVHDISARVTFDDDMTVLEVVAEMDAIPFTLCGGGKHGIEELVGAYLGKGWRRRLDDALGATKGCTHLRELLLGVATVAYQTVSAEAERAMRSEGRGAQDLIEPPFYIGGCHSMAVTSEVVGRFYPQFHVARDEGDGDEE
jgi:hypothetical protein